MVKAKRPLSREHSEKAGGNAGTFLVRFRYNLHHAENELRSPRRPARHR